MPRAAAQGAHRRYRSHNGSTQRAALLAKGVTEVVPKVNFEQEHILAEQSLYLDPTIDQWKQAR